MDDKKEWSEREDAGVDGLFPVDEHVEEVDEGGQNHPS